MHLSTKWWLNLAGAAIITGAYVVKHIRKALDAWPDKQDGPLSFGSLVGDMYNFRNGVFRLKSPDGTVAVQDGPAGVLFSDIAGGFLMVECHEIPHARTASLDGIGPRRFIGVFIEEMLVPQRIAPTFGMPLLREGYLPTGCEPGTYYVDGTIRGGSTFAKFSPDGDTNQLDLRLGLLATIRDDRIFVFIRGVTPNHVCGGADDFEGIQEYLVSTMHSAKLQDQHALTST